MAHQSGFDRVAFTTNCRRSPTRTPHKVQENLDQPSVGAKSFELCEQTILNIGLSAHLSDQSGSSEAGGRLGTRDWPKTLKVMCPADISESLNPMLVPNLLSGRLNAA